MRLIPSVVLIFVSMLLLFTVTARADDYVIVVSRQTQADADWSKVVNALVAAHDGATVVTWDKHVSEASTQLRKRHPSYTCFVSTGEETTREFVGDVHRLTRGLDADPYTDTLWGILTGYDATNALRIAEHREPLTVQNVASGTEIALEMCAQGVWFDELVKHKKVSRKPGGESKQEQGPADTTHALAATLTDQAADLFVTSGHATERDWQIGFRYRNGQFRSSGGKMFGVTTGGERFEIHSEHPKVYLPIGNCLMGHIDGPDAMALAWMNSVGVHQMIGYTVVTWYGYGGWGVLDYFVEQPGRYTFSEAFHANHHALIHRLDSYFDGAADVNFPIGSRKLPSLAPNQAGKSLGLSAADSRGLLWDRDTVAFYGDPAWAARMAQQPTAYEQSLSIDGETYRLTIKPNRGQDSFRPINTNGSQRGWRPIVEFLPHRIGEATIVAGEDLDPVITDDFILIPNPRTCDPSRRYEVTFTASRIR